MEEQKEEKDHPVVGGQGQEDNVEMLEEDDRNSSNEQSILAEYSDSLENESDQPEESLDLEDLNSEQLENLAEWENELYQDKISQKFISSQQPGHQSEVISQENDKNNHVIQQSQETPKDAENKQISRISKRLREFSVPEFTNHVIRSLIESGEQGNSTDPTIKFDKQAMQTLITFAKEVFDHFTNGFQEECEELYFKKYQTQKSVQMGLCKLFQEKAFYEAILENPKYSSYFNISVLTKKIEELEKAIEGKKDKAKEYQRNWKKNKRKNQVTTKEARQYKLQQKITKHYQNKLVKDSKRKKSLADQE
ncbi:hypothetical protein FGO68_gene2341 [Halteria grandinella]|uniref:Uncharacterized protein n=1 Tax=Halteria grandinella TaxID=5974 RepID=A0A8J8NWU2_HALGN|nr:hypothetical protein FGO68_gene2341 [Halteria grandinella]